MFKKIRKYILLSLLGLSYGLFSYNFFNGWWYASLGTLSIVLVSYLLWGNSFLSNLGLKLTLLDFIRTIILAVFVTACSYLMMSYIGRKYGVLIEYTSWHSYFHDVFYIINEEIILGAIFLSLLLSRAKLSALKASLVLAVVFALIHFIFYKWIFLDKGIIGIITLLTLFMIGFLRNSIILITGHIGYSWALHFGWMAVMFGSIHVYKESNQYLNEPERFNRYLGSFEMMIFASILTVIFFIYWRKIHFKTKLNSLY